MLYTFLRPLVWLVLHTAYALLGGIRYTGRDLVPRTGGVLITPNHISDADPTAIGLALPRPCYFMAKEELFQIPLLGRFIRAMHGFPVKRYSADRSALRMAEQLLKQGEAVVIFPEGKLSEDGQIQELLPGVLLIAQRAGVPIVPAIIEGTDTLMPYGKVLPRPARRRICVRFGTPVTVEDLTGGEKGGDALKQGAERLRARMLALQGRESPEIPAESRPVRTSEERCR
ncbi:MAG TPA: lysophospholipid acyltransferase family protein [Chthonomonadaceae bacterium]|nr:lysophospholipid acyltransferase family protein [Chthonomonadaceae bacterium]